MDVPGERDAAVDAVSAARAAGFPRFEPMGEAAVVVRLADGPGPAAFDRVRRFAAALEAGPPAGLIEFTPAYTTVALFYDPLRQTFEGLVAAARALLDRGAGRVRVAPRTVDLPVCYGGDHGPDLAEVARQAGLDEAGVIRLHAGADYLVHGIGFAPGFPYLGGLPARLATPRRATPRVRVPAGSVGIAGGQTGVYPLETPGGWQLIGRTPLRLFRPEAEPPARLRVGDRVRFRAIGPAEFDALREREP